MKASKASRARSCVSYTRRHAGTSDHQASPPSSVAALDAAASRSRSPRAADAFGFRVQSTVDSLVCHFTPASRVLRSISKTLQRPRRPLRRGSLTSRSHLLIWPTVTSPWALRPGHCVLIRDSVRPVRARSVPGRLVELDTSGGGAPIRRHRLDRSPRNVHVPGRQLPPRKVHPERNVWRWSSLRAVRHRDWRPGRSHGAPMVHGHAVGGAIVPRRPSPGVSVAL